MSSVLDRKFDIIGVPLIVALVVVLLGSLGGGVALGAHSWWASSTAITGAGLAILPAAAMRYWAPPQLWIKIAILCDLVISVGVAVWGKMRFAASFAEDTFGGQMWYFGWIAIAFFLVLFLCAFAMKKA